VRKVCVGSSFSVTGSRRGGHFLYNFYFIKQFQAFVLGCVDFKIAIGSEE